jgi:hypothetical protein
MSNIRRNGRSRKPPIGASPELISHHIDAHDRSCLNTTPHPTDPLPARTCPCGRSMILCCGNCGTPLFTGFRPGFRPCRHARELVNLSAA